MMKARAMNGATLGEGCNTDGDDDADEGWMGHRR
jgi:hypothetical protein